MYDTRLIFYFDLTQLSATIETDGLLLLQNRLKSWIHLGFDFELPRYAECEDHVRVCGMTTIVIKHTMGTSGMQLHEIVACSN